MYIGGMGGAAIIAGVMPTMAGSANAMAAAAFAAYSERMSLGAATVGEPAVEAVQAVGRGDSVRVASFDLSAGFLKAVADGKAAFAIDQQQFLQGYLLVAFLAFNAKYGLMPGGNVPSGPILVTEDKASQVIELSSKGIR